ncbi:MAG: co-chaperone DjlA [Gammaproteobacteria bacterium]|nr:co-chaperone DjlA [Gammaproteobacteria bacterium]
MSWWGKILGGGFGFMMGGPLGAMMGMAFGHQLDKGMSTLELDIGDPERTQAAFFTATFSIMGYLAKADGQVTKDEISMARKIMAHMNLSPDQQHSAIELFNQGKSADFPLDEILAQFKQECHRRRNLLQMFLEILISTAFADGTLHSAEKRALQHISQAIGFNNAQLEHLLSMISAQQHYSQNQGGSAKVPLGDAYKALGIASTASDAEIKKAYRRQMSQHHPDKLVSRGLPEEMIKLATEKTQEIKAAYEQIKKSRL